MNTTQPESWIDTDIDEEEVPPTTDTTGANTHSAGVVPLAIFTIGTSE